MANQDPTKAGLVPPVDSTTAAEKADVGGAALVWKLPSANEPVAVTEVGSTSGAGCVGAFVFAGVVVGVTAVSPTGGALIGPTASRQNRSAAGKT